MSDKFIAVVKLKTGEEVIAKIGTIPETDLVELDSPAIIISSSFVRKPGLSILKIEPWIKTGREKIYIVEMSNIITTCEVLDKDVIKTYNKFVKLYYEDEEEEPKLLKKPKMTKEMGYISSVKEARHSLEKIYKNS
tara:strand:- start:859 stop:1266 length:408 start_codon:yes stop_codon:yes gene_type:complete